MTEIVVPKWGLTVDEVTLVAWLTSVGEPVSVGDSVAEVETDKVTTEITSQVEGTVVELLVEEGAVLDIGQPIAKIDP
jgi:glutaconyl-CoA/methylmalonyl-CoA decarboxylase subunit gamma